MAIAQIDLEMLHRLVSQEPLTAAGAKFGDLGSARIKDILRFLKKSARYSTVTELSDITIFALLAENEAIREERSQHATKYEFGVSQLGAIGRLVVEIRQDGSPYVWNLVPPDIHAAIQDGIVYRLNQGVETFTLSGTSIAVPKLIPGAISQYCLNCFTDLKDALLAYRDSMARTSKCHLIREAWAEENRLWFVPKPEYRLRKALANHLTSFLRHDEIDVREEQNVDESHPVDIKLVWRMENRSAIIEVKWLGKSMDNATRSVTQKFTDVRARTGAKQLAEYLESHRQQAAKEDTRGYLVIFDCRRRGISPSDATVSRSKGHYYATRDVSYSPEYHKTRKDFEEPIRMFLEPVCV